MLSNYMNVDAPTMLTLFSHLFINVVFVATFFGFCARKSNEKSPENETRPEGGNEECFTPPHISQLPCRSVLRQKHRCPIHGQCSEDSDEESTLTQSHNDSDVTFDSTQMNTANISFLERCSCFINQKRVRFQCPSSISSKPITFNFQ